MNESPPKKKQRLSFSLKGHSKPDPARNTRRSPRKVASPKSPNTVNGTTKGKSRFLVTSAEDLDRASKKAIPRNTTTAVNWAFRIFQNWVTHSQGNDDCLDSVEDLWSRDDPTKVSKMLSQFCLEVKQRNGKPYTCKLLLQILVNLQKYARSINQECFYFMNTKDHCFSQVHTVLDNLACKLNEEGIEAKKNQACVVSVAEEAELWRTGTMGSDTPLGLQNAVFYYCGTSLLVEHDSIVSINNPSVPINNPSDTEMTGMMKKFNFQAVHGCTFNFNFSTK